MTLSRAVADFLDSVRRVKRSDKTVARYRKDLKILTSIAELEFRDQVSAFTESLVNRYFDFQVKKGLSAQTLSGRRCLLRQFARWGVEEGLWLTDPTRRVAQYTARRKPPRPYEPHERAALRDLGPKLTDPMERVLHALLCHTPLRIGTIQRLRVGDIVLSDGTRLGHIRTVHKGGKELITPVIPELDVALAAYLTPRADAPMAFLFPSPAKMYDATGHLIREPRPISYDALWERVRSWGAATGVRRVTPHKFRHDYASRLAERDVKIEVIQEALGHSDLNTTRVYVALANKAVENAAMLLSENKEA